MDRHADNAVSANNPIASFKRPMALYLIGQPTILLRTPVCGHILRINLAFATRANDCDTMNLFT